FSKIEAGHLELEQQPFDLVDCIESCLDLLATRAAEKELELAYFMDGTFVPRRIVGDGTRLRQILINLLGNAIKFTEKGEVVLSIAAGLPGIDGKQELHFAIRDMGIGIPPKRMDRLFHSFSQVDASTTRRYGGTGLGLVISKRLSELMGGTMWAESRGVPGQGSTFHFTIVAVAVSSISTGSTGHHPHNLHGKHLLLVSDNPTLHHVLSQQVEVWGMVPQLCMSGPEALTWLGQRGPCDVMLLDRQLSTQEMDALTLATILRAQPDTHDLPLILLAPLGHRKVSDKERALNITTYLAKPIKQSHLYDTLVSIFCGDPLPLQSAQERMGIDPQMAKRLPLRILVAEDNAVNQLLAQHLLRQMGYKSDVVATGREAVEALLRQPYDVVLMDVQMPEMDGLEATRFIREELPRAQQPYIIAMTANAMQGDRELCLEAGMNDYVSKPILVLELVRALQRCQPEIAPVQETTGAVPFQSPLDMKVWERFRASVSTDQPDFLVQLLDIFLTNTPKLLTALSEAAQQRNSEEVQRIAHTLKSNSDTFGALALAAMCRKLENLGKQGTLDGILAHVEQVELEYDRVRTALEQVRKELFL
ncbi:MAG: response regulator, partial [Ardenticatenales bacterium]|nr:response regulator [Ardenticatenales bacterium]